MKLTFIFPDGHSRNVTAAAGQTVLEAAHANDIPIEGACGGQMACSTCHVIVDERASDRLPPPTDEESGILDLADGLTRHSRLGCQIVLTPSLDGMALRLPTLVRSLLD